MQLRRDDALAFLRRAKARPVSLGPHFGVSSPSTPSLMMKGGDVLLALGGGDSETTNPQHHSTVMDVTHSYLLSLVAAHVSVLKPSSTPPTNSSANSASTAPTIDSGARVHWIAMPGSKPPLPHQLLQAIEVAVVQSFEQPRPFEQHQRPPLSAMPTTNRRAAAPLSTVVGRSLLQELVLSACSLITISSPPDVASLLTTLNPSTIFGSETTGYKTPTSFGAVPLVVLTGLGYYESVVQIAERHIGAAAPIRSALSELLAALPCALALSETSSLPPRVGAGVSSSPRGGSRYDEFSSTISYNNNTSDSNYSSSAASAVSATTSAVLYSYTFKLLCDINRVGGSSSFFPSAMGNNPQEGSGNNNTKPPYLHQSDRDLRTATLSLLQSACEDEGANEGALGGQLSATGTISHPKGRLSAQQQPPNTATTTIPFQYVVVPTSATSTTSSSRPIRIYSSSVNPSGSSSSNRGSYTSSSTREVGVVLTPL